MKTTALYIRVSTQDQAADGYSLEAQRKSLESLAQTKGFSGSILYGDAGISGKDVQHRPEMKRLLEDVKKKDTSCSCLVIIQINTQRC